MHLKEFYIGGEWVSPVDPAAAVIDVINPATEAPYVQIALGGAADVDRAVAAAKAAFPTYSAWSREDRIALFERIRDGFEARAKELAEAVSKEMGSPIKAALSAQVASGQY